MEVPEAISYDVGLPQVLSSTLGFYEKTDTEISLAHDQSWLPLGHYLVMIVDGTYLLKRCLEERNYRALSSYKEL